MRGWRCWLLGLGAGVAASAAAQDADAPDLGFLEYLGSWQESDEEWLVVAGLGDELDAENDIEDTTEQEAEAGEGKRDRPVDESDAN